MSSDQMIVKQWLCWTNTIKSTFFSLLI